MLTLQGFRAASVRNSTLTPTYPGSSLSAGRQSDTATNVVSDGFSSMLAAENTNATQHVSRISQEIRTSTTTADIRELRRAVEAGEYHPDPAAIAAKILMRMGD